MPEQPGEIARAALECYNAGAAIVHIHARDEQGKPTGTKEKFEEIVRATRKDDWQPATIYHLLALLTSQNGRHLSGSFMAPGSLCIDDFEYPACVVLSINGEDRRIGLGNWRGSKIGGYNVVRVKREQDILNSGEVK